MRAPITWIGPGASCASTLDYCIQAGTGSGICSETTLRCESLPRSGYACAMESCAEGSFCDGVGVCRTKILAGQPCALAGLRFGVSGQRAAG